MFKNAAIQKTSGVSHYLAFVARATALALLLLFGRSCRFGHRGRNWISCSKLLPQALYLLLLQLIDFLKILLLELGLTYLFLLLCLVLIKCEHERVDAAGEIDENVGFGGTRGLFVVLGYNFVEIRLQFLLLPDIGFALEFGPHLLRKSLEDVVVVDLRQIIVDLENGGFLLLNQVLNLAPVLVLPLAVAIGFELLYRFLS